MKRPFGHRDLATRFDARAIALRACIGALFALAALDVAAYVPMIDPSTIERTPRPTATIPRPASGDIKAAGAVNLQPPAYFPRTTNAMFHRGIGRLCLRALLRAGAPSRARMWRSTGDAELDKSIVADLVRELDDIERLDVTAFERQADGRYLVELDVDVPQAGDNALGCAATTREGSR